MILISGLSPRLRCRKAHFGCSEGVLLVAKRAFVCFREIFGERPSGAWGSSATLQPPSPLLTLFDTAEPWSQLEGLALLHTDCYCTRMGGWWGDDPVGGGDRRAAGGSTGGGSGGDGRRGGSGWGWSGRRVIPAGMVGGWMVLAGGRWGSLSPRCPRTARKRAPSPETSLNGAPKPSRDGRDGSVRVCGRPLAYSEDIE